MRNGVASLGNGLNRAVGESQNAFGFNVATAWDIEISINGSFEVTETTILIPDRGSRAHAITELGDICGIVDQTSGWPEAFVIRDQILSELPSGRLSESWAWDLNNFEVAGATGRKYKPQDAARWNSRNKLEGSTTILGAEWAQSEALGTNDLGELVGVGDKDGTGTRTAWLLRVTSDQ